MQNDIAGYNLEANHQRFFESLARFSKTLERFDKSPEDQVELCDRLKALKATPEEVRQFLTIALED